MNKPALSSIGFTLIELLVSILVVSILVGLGYANFRRYSQRQAVWAVARQIEGDLRKAQSYAMAGKSGCNPQTEAFLGYRFHRVSSSTYSFAAACRNLNTIRYVDEVPVNLPSSFVLSAFGDIVFNSPKGNTNLSSDRTITVSLVSGLYPVRITVSSGGKITVSE